MILSATPQMKPIAAPLLLDEVTQDLAQDQNLIRIKKLLIYACTQTWENDQSRLAQINLRDLLSSLLMLAPTCEQLQAHLNGIVNTLNKAAEYTLVANAIMGRVNQLYSDENSIQQPLLSQQSYGAIAPLLEQDPDQLRIKKLLILACKHYWETDPTRLNQFSLSDLIQELHNLAPTLETLKAVLENSVKTLSKRTEYTLIAHKISHVFQPLYLTDSTTTSASTPGSSTNISETSAAILAIAADATEALTPSLHNGLDNALDSIPDSAEINYSAANNAKVHPKPSAQPTQTHSEAEFGYIRQRQDLANLFNLRLEIMQYTSPFQAKVLLFSLLHEPFKFTAEHDLILRQHELDDLLRILIQTYKLLADLELKLNSTANSLSLENAEDYSQVASTILRIIKPFYAYLPLDSALSLKGDYSVLNAIDSATNSATNIIGSKAMNHETTQPDYCLSQGLEHGLDHESGREKHSSSDSPGDSPDDEYTCQISA